MIRLLVRTAVLLAANAIGLLVAAALLDGMTLDATGFIVALVVFTVAVALLQPFLANAMRGQGGNIGALGAVALIATLISLIFTVLVTDGLSIDGIGTWIGAAIVVWLAALVAAFILPFLGLKKYLENN